MKFDDTRFDARGFRGHAGRAPGERHADRGRPHRRAAGVGAIVAALLAGAGLAGAPAHAADPAPQKPAASQDWPKDAPRGGHRHGGPGMGPGGMMIPGMMHPGMLEHMADELGLSTEQRQTIRGFFDAAKPAMQDLSAKLRANAQQLMSVTPDDPKYATVVQKASQEAGALTTQLIQQASQVRVQVYGVLTPEQKKTLAAKQAEMQQRMEQHRRDRAERRGGPDAPDAPPPPPKR